MMNGKAIEEREPFDDGFAGILMEKNMDQQKAKAAAKAVQGKIISLIGGKISLQQAHEVLAAAHGFENWHVMSAKLGSTDKSKYKAGAFTCWLSNTTEDGANIGLPCDCEENETKIDFDIDQTVLDEIVRQARERKIQESPGVASFKLMATRPFMIKTEGDEEFAELTLANNRWKYSQEDLEEYMSCVVEVGTNDLEDDGTIRCSMLFEMWFKHYGMQEIAWGGLVIEPAK